MTRLPLLVIGVGNEYRSDDSVGVLVARRLHGLLPSGVEVHEASGEASTLVDLWADTDSVILVDAVASGAAPGTIFRFDAHTEAIPAHYFRCASTHAFGVVQAIELARALDSLPRRLVVYGIEGADFGFGTGLSPDVDRALSEVVCRIRDEVNESTSSSLTSRSR